MDKLTKHPTEYSAEERRAIYSQLVREERSNLRGRLAAVGETFASYSQITACKGRATKRFNALGL